jgi:hypothetical protein
MMAAMAKFRDDIGALTTTAGTSTAYTLTSNQGFTSLTNGLICGFYLHTACGATVTLNVDGLGAKPLRAVSTVELYSGQVPPGVYRATYYTSNSEWILQDAAMTLAIGSTPTSFRNVVGRNGGMEIWQRGTSIAQAASLTAYTADGWYLKNGANQASVVSRQSGLTNQSVYCAQVQRNSGQTGTGTMYFACPLDVDELQKMRGQLLVLSFTASAGANWSPTSGTLTYTLYVGTGGITKRGASAFTGETTPITSSVNLTPGGGAGRTVSAVSSSVATNIGQAELQFNWAPTGTAGANDWVQIDDIQLEIMPANFVGTPIFERTDHAQDLARCYRHWNQTYEEGTAPGTVTSTAALKSITNGAGTSAVSWQLPIEMRATPTYVVYNAITGATNTWQDGGGNDRSIVLQNNSKRGVTASCTTASNNSAIAGHLTADATI